MSGTEFTKTPRQDQNENKDLIAALAKLGIPSVNHSRFQNLPSTTETSLWNDLSSGFNLTIFELGALQNERCGDSKPPSTTLKTIEINVPCDILMLKRRVAKLLIRNHLHGTAVRKRFVDEQQQESYYTEIIVRGLPSTIAQFSSSLNSIINSMNPSRSTEVTVSVRIIDDEMELESNCQRNAAFGGDEIIFTQQDIDAWNFEGVSPSSSVEALQRVAAPFAPLLATNIRHSLLSYTRGLMDTTILKKRIFVKNTKENMKKIVFVTDLVMDWDWLQEYFPHNLILKREIKDRDGDLFTVEFPTQLNNNDSLYITFA